MKIRVGDIIGHRLPAITLFSNGTGSDDRRGVSGWSACPWRSDLAREEARRIEAATRLRSTRHSAPSLPPRCRHSVRWHSAEWEHAAWRPAPCALIQVTHLVATHRAATETPQSTVGSRAPGCWSGHLTSRQPMEPGPDGDPSHHPPL